MIYPVVGNIGSGKSIFLTGMAYLHEASGYDIYSNFSMTDIPFKRIWDIEDFSEIKSDKIAVFIDEIQLTADARRSGSELNILFSRNMTQSRKWGKISHVYVATQSFFFMDVRIRTLANRVYEPSIWKWDDFKNPLALKIKYINMNEDRKMIRSFRFPLVMDGKYIPDMYNTLEMLTDIKDKTAFSNMDKLVEKYSDMPVSKKTQLASLIQYKEAQKGNYMPRSEASMIADCILIGKEALTA
jgi:hypothetical protein